MSVSAPFLGFVCAGIGVALLLVAAGGIAVDPSTIHAPRWVLGVCGGVFVLGGVALAVPQVSSLRIAAGMTTVLGLGLVAAWAAWFGDAEGFSGGLPFVPDTVNVALARGVFGFGALCCLALFGWGVSRLMRGLPVE